MFTSGTLSGERRKEAEKQRKVKEILDRINYLNEQPPTGESRAELERLAYALSVVDKDRADGLMAESRGHWVGNRMAICYFDPNPEPQRRRPLPDPRAERCWEIGQLLRALNIGLIVNDGLEPQKPELYAEAVRLQGLSEYRKVAVGLELTNELDRLPEGPRSLHEQPVPGRPRPAGDRRPQLAGAGESSRRGREPVQPGARGPEADPRQFPGRAAAVRPGLLRERIVSTLTLRDGEAPGEEFRPSSHERMTILVNSLCSRWPRARRGLVAAAHHQHVWRDLLAVPGQVWAALAEARAQGRPMPGRLRRELQGILAPLVARWGERDKPRW